MTIRWFVELISNFIAANWSEERDRWLFNVPRLKVDRHVEGPEWNISNNLISVSLCLPLIISDIFCWSSNSNKQKCSSSPLFLQNSIASSQISTIYFLFLKVETQIIRNLKKKIEFDCLVNQTPTYLPPGGRCSKHLNFDRNNFLKKL